MTKKTSKPYRTAPLQKFRVRPITDPAEQAALDERLKRSEEACASERAAEGSSPKGLPLAVLELCRHLSAEGRLLVANGLTEQLSLEERIGLLKLLTTQLPPEALDECEEHFLGQREALGRGGNSADGTKQEERSKGAER
jgi:hypothetical protein